MDLLIVLGMHRSGTSALTGLLSRLNFNTNVQLVPSDEHNKNGYFEGVLLNQILDKLLKDLDSSWDDDRLLPINWLESEAAIQAKREIVDLFNKEYDFRHLVVIKDPRLSRLLPLLQSALNIIKINAKYIISLRTPYAVIRSLFKRNGISEQRAALIYVAHLIEAELYTRECPRVFIDYENLLSDWKSTVSLIVHSLNLNLKEFNTIEPLQIKEIDDFLSVDLNNYCPLGVIPTGTSIDLALETYFVLKNNFNTIDFSAIDDLRSRWISYIQSLEPWISEAATLKYCKADLLKNIYSPSIYFLNEASKMAKSEIYWSTQPGNFSQENSLFTHWSYGVKVEQRLILPSINPSINEFRWDITDRPAYCLIEKVWIENPKGDLVWAWKPTDNLIVNPSADLKNLGLNEIDQLQVLVTGFDAHSNLQIPINYISKLAEGWAFCTVWSAYTTTTALNKMAEDLIRARSKLIILDSSLSSILVERDNFQQKVYQQANELEKIMVKQKNSSEEIKRAEVQLSLLKDLWLGK